MKSNKDVENSLKSMFIPDQFFLKSKKGVLEMATGTGKTSTALEIVRQLLIKKEIEKRKNEGCLPYNTSLMFAYVNSL